jgi:glutaredoxin
VTEIVLLTKDECELCDQAKATLERLSAEFKLRVREVALDSTEGAELAREAGAPFPPVVFVDGRAFSYGRVSERKLRKTLRV